MVIRDPSRGPKSRSRCCDRALGHRSQNRSTSKAMIHTLLSAYLNYTPHQRRRAQSDPPQTSHFAARRCDRTYGRSHACGGRSGHIPSGKGAKTGPNRPYKRDCRSIIPVMDQATVPVSRAPSLPGPGLQSRTARRLAAASISPNTRESYRRALRQVDAWRGRRPLGRRDPGRLLGRPLRRWPHPEQRGRRRRRRPLPRPHGRPLFGRSHRRTRRGRLLPVAP